MGKCVISKSQAMLCGDRLARFDEVRQAAQKAVMDGLAVVRAGLNQVLADQGMAPLPENADVAILLPEGGRLSHELAWGDDLPRAPAPAADPPPAPAPASPPLPEKDPA